MEDDDDEEGTGEDEEDTRNLGLEALSTNGLKSDGVCPGCGWL